uniref:Uncharacterized protein n=1 Tax=Setaria digitata TaxID=48799 RepID=A0A915PQ79_9BILA
MTELEEDLEGTGAPLFEDIMSERDVLEEYGVSVSGTMLSEDEIPSPSKMSYEFPVGRDQFMKRCVGTRVIDSKECDYRFDPLLVGFELNTRAVAENTIESPVVNILETSKVFGSGSGIVSECCHDTDMHTTTEKFSFKNGLVEGEWEAPDVQDVNETIIPLNRNDRVVRNKHAKILSEDDFHAKPDEEALVDEMSILKHDALVEEYNAFEEDVVSLPKVTSFTEGEDGISNIYKTVFSEPDVSISRTLAQQFLAEKDPMTTGTEHFRDGVSEYHVSEKFSVSRTKELVTEDNRECQEQKSKYFDKDLPVVVELFRIGDLEETEARQNEKISSGGDVKCYNVMMTKKLHIENECVGSKAEGPTVSFEADHEGVILARTMEVETETLKQVSPAGAQTEKQFKFAVYQRKELEISVDKTSTAKLEECQDQLYMVEDLVGSRMQTVKNISPPDYGVSLLKELDSDVSALRDLWKSEAPEVGNSGTVRKHVEEEAVVKEHGTTQRCRVVDGELSIELSSTEEKKEDIAFLKDAVISCKVPFAGMAVGYPACGTGDIVGTEVEQWRSDLQGTDKSNLEMKRSPTKGESIQESKEEIVQLMKESLSEIKDMGELPELQRSISRELIETERVESWIPSRLHSTAISEQSKPFALKENEFEGEKEMETFRNLSTYLDETYEHKINTAETEKDRKIDGAGFKNKLNAEEGQRFIKVEDDKFPDLSLFGTKFLKFPKEPEMIPGRVVLEAATVSPDTTAICDYARKSDGGDILTEQLPGLDYPQLKSSAVSEQLGEGVMMQKIAAMKGTKTEQKDGGETTTLLTVDMSDLHSKDLIKVNEAQLNMRVAEQHDNTPFPAINSSSQIDPVATFIPEDVQQMDVEKLHVVSEGIYTNRLSVGKSRLGGKQTGTFCKEDLQREIPEDRVAYPVVSLMEEVEERKRVAERIKLLEGERINVDETLSEKGTSYEINLGTTNPLFTDSELCINKRAHPFPVEVEYSCESTTDSMWIPEEEECYHVTTELEKLESCLEHKMTYMSICENNTEVPEERTTGNLLKPDKEPEVQLIGSVSENHSKPMISEKFETHKQTKEWTKEIRETVFKQVTEPEDQFTTGVSEVDNEGGTELFATLRSESVSDEEEREYEMKSSQITRDKNISVELLTPQEWSECQKKSIEEAFITKKQISELEESVDAISFNRDRKESVKATASMESFLELTEEQTVQNHGEPRICGSDSITVPQKSFDVSLSKKLNTEPHPVIPFESKFEGDVHGSCDELSMEEHKNTERKNTTSEVINSKGDAAAIMETLTVLGYTEVSQMVNEQKSFPMNVSFGTSEESVEEGKLSNDYDYEEGLKRNVEVSTISVTEAFEEPNNPIICDGVSNVVCRQMEDSEGEETVTRKQLDIAEIRTEKSVILSNSLHKHIYKEKEPYLIKRKECREFLLSGGEETEDGSSSSISSVSPTYVKDMRAESLTEVEQRSESLEITAVVSEAESVAEENITNKFGHSEGECQEAKEDVWETESVRDGNNFEVERTVEPTSEVFSEELLILNEASSSRQKTAKESSEMDEKAKIARGSDIETNANQQLLSRNIRKLGETANNGSSSSSSYSVDLSTGKDGDGKSSFGVGKATIGNYPSHVQHDYEVDYESDLKEKLQTLSQETKTLKLRLSERSVLTEDERSEEELNIRAIEVVGEIMKPAESLSHSESTYKTATATSKDGYETCLTSQEDTYETAPDYHSQESEYTTATSEASSRLSEVSDERRESATPIAMLSPVHSDRLFTASQDDEQEPDKQGNPVSDSKRSSPDMPDIELVSVEDEDDTEESVLLTSSSGILLAPDIDPGRPISPVPPGSNDEDEGIVVVVASSDCFRKVADQTRQGEIKVLDAIVEAPGDDMFTDEIFSPWRRELPDRTTSQQSIHEKAMNLQEECFPQYSKLSAEHQGSTVIHKFEEDEGALPSEAILCVESDSLDSLDKISLKSGNSGKKYSTSRRSSTSSRKSLHDEPLTFVERLTPELKMAWIEKDQDAESAKQSLLSPSREYPAYMSESEQVNPTEVELETVDEEPEEVDSLNGRSICSNGQGTDISIAVGKYKTVSSDNVSETSLQEFERIERDVLNKGESSLSGSEVELYIAGKLKAADGSTSSLAEFERLEQEVVAEGSPQDEVMILSDIREESEVEEMSIRDDDEEEHDSISDIKAIPVEEDPQMPTPLASPTDSIERNFEKFVPEVMETSIDSLEINLSPVQTQGDLVGENYLTEYEVIDKVYQDVHDSLEVIPQGRDSMLKERASIQELTKDKQALLSDDGTMGIYQEEEKDSLVGDMDMLRDYPTTLTTFETTQINADGSTEIISRRVLTRVTDPVISHVQFTGTENEHRLRDLEREEEFETTDVEGNVTRTTLHRSAPSSSATGASHSAHRD